MGFRQFKQPRPRLSKSLPATRKEFKTNKFSEKACEQLGLQFAASYVYVFLVGCIVHELKKRVNSWDCNLQHRMCRFYVFFLHYFSNSSPILRNGLLLNTFKEELKTTNFAIGRCDTSVRTYLLTYLLGYPPR